MKVKKVMIPISELKTYFLPANRQTSEEGLSIIDRTFEFSLVMRFDKNG